MQYLKEEIKQRIFDEAKNEFYENGYKNANMREIAKRSDITVGNIYRYFPSKSELFEAIIEPVLEKLKRLLMFEPMLNFKKIDDVSVLNKFIHAGVRMCADYTREIIIIVSKSEGTKYENSYDYLKKILANSINKTLDKEDLELSEAISASLISGMVFILVKHINNPEKIERLSTDLIFYLFSTVQNNKN